MADNAGTLLVTVPVARARIHGLSAILVDDRDIMLRIPGDAAKPRAFQEHVSHTLPRKAVSLESFVPWDADSMLWKTGNTEPQILTKVQTELRCTSLAFLAFGLQQEKDECMMVED